MKSKSNMKTAGIVLIVTTLALCAGMAMAQQNTRQEVLDSINLVPIGAPGNLPDNVNASPYGSNVAGAVPYEYLIGKYEITVGQWNRDLGSDNTPILTTWYDQAEFCNWLTSGDPDVGAYDTTLPGWGDLQSDRHPMLVDRTSSDMLDLVAEYGTVYLTPTEDEWYKAAYYSLEDNRYYSYANGSDTVPTMATSITSGGWNYGNAVGALWDVGSGTEEQNGTYDMMGNGRELNETIVSEQYGIDYNGERGGGSANPSGYLGSDWSSRISPSEALAFRVVSIVPEPSSLLMGALGVVVLLGWRRRRR